MFRYKFGICFDFLVRINFTCNYLSAGFSLPKLLLLQGKKKKKGHILTELMVTI